MRQLHPRASNMVKELLLFCLATALHIKMTRRFSSPGQEKVSSAGSRRAFGSQGCFTPESP